MIIGLRVESRWSWLVTSKARAPYRLCPFFGFYLAFPPFSLWADDVKPTLWFANCSAPFVPSESAQRTKKEKLWPCLLLSLSGTHRLGIGIPSSPARSSRSGRVYPGTQGSHRWPRNDAQSRLHRRERKRISYYFYFYYWLPAMLLGICGGLAKLLCSLPWSYQLLRLLLFVIYLNKEPAEK